MNQLVRVTILLVTSQKLQQVPAFEIGYIPHNNATFSEEKDLSGFVPYFVFGHRVYDIGQSCKQQKEE